MKPNIRPGRAVLLVALIWALTIAALPLIPGCAGGPNRVAYQTLVTTRTTVQEAMGLFNVWVGDQTAKGIDTKPTELKVRDAFNKWKAAQLLVLDAARLNATAISTNAAGQTGTSAALEFAIANASQLKADLFNLLIQVGVKLPNI